MAKVTPYLKDTDMTPLEGAVALLAAWRYLADTTINGDVYNKYLYDIPAEVQDAFLIVGKWIADLLF